MSRAAIFLGCLLMFFALQPAHATSIVVKLDKEQIILAADTREDRFEADPLNPKQAFHDDSCKIIPLGPNGAAISGNLDTSRTRARLAETGICYLGYREI
jgi:hypothetical protein